ncbi:hypothetical protein CEUSTIGMA_g11342.t1 [Chlamydomonas eustigma]|uniref:DUF7699 domain-containing protein n=1 Tax=Chlamydomonas eustigma TaxID=1157962 RepID=A0A250XLG1_9CHLO|nr:hypothetical protein CEUSTIGMA_g11342.t1 [Chlamydomonas eustigma]|eukprot:GAX83918.1 hypothetical protein CEUSTIGMA_g11342.t1 [Chlamydomonas eustigma]
MPICHNQRSIVVNVDSSELGPLEECTVVQLKAFLYRADLKATGLKAELMGRVEDFLSMKRTIGNRPETFASQTRAMKIMYPEASFSVTCRWVCKGDEVLFSQEVFDRYDVETQTGHCIGVRQVAGRIIRDSYGALQQQHTFTIEVLWSAGTRPKQPMTTMMIKGRNIYRSSVGRREVRQLRRRPWQDESLRSVVMREKVERGKEARALRRDDRTRVQWHWSLGVRREQESGGIPALSRNIPADDKDSVIIRDAEWRGGKVPLSAVEMMNISKLVNRQMTRYNDNNDKAGITAGAVVAVGGTTAHPLSNCGLKLPILLPTATTNAGAEGGGVGGGWCRRCGAVAATVACLHSLCGACCCGAECRRHRNSFKNVMHLRR